MRRHVAGSGRQNRLDDAAQAEWLPLLAVLLGGVLLHSMNVMMLATVLPSIVEEVGGAALMSWPTTAFLASSIVAATCTGRLTARFGARSAFAVGALVFGAGRAALRAGPVDGLRRRRPLRPGLRRRGAVRHGLRAGRQRVPRTAMAARRLAPVRRVEPVHPGRAPGRRHVRDLGQLARLLLCRDDLGGRAGGLRAAVPAARARRARRHRRGVCRSAASR